MSQNILQDASNANKTNMQHTQCMGKQQLCPY